MKRILKNAAFTAAVLLTNINIGLGQIITNPPGGNGELPPHEPMVRAISPASPFSLNVEWIDQSLSETGFRLFRQKEGGESVLIKTYSPGFAGSGTVHQFTDTGLRACTKYCYRVTAYNSTATSISDTVCTSTPTASRTEGVMQIDVRAEDTYAKVSIVQDLSWAAGHHYYFRANGDRAWTAASVKDDNVIGLLPETSYCFQARPYDCGGEGLASNQVCAFTKKKRPSLPTIISTQTTENSISVTWRDNATDEEGYRVWVSDMASPAILYGRLNGDTTTTTIPGLWRDHHYTIYVAAFKSLAPDALVTAEATTLPATLPDLRPTGIYATSTGAVYFTICNDGLQNTGMVDIRLELDDVLLIASQFGIPMPDGSWGIPGKSCVQANWQTRGVSGRHTFRVTVGLGGKPELYFNNNTAWASITLP